ncbi:UPF0175 family protein [Burkholderia gladioli]|uniref:UPF0175 family protein n=1 Tax=Burkholderia gladioli TaxID=28095 RepID=UPI001F49EACA|nr:UPF0175 family protein [Burkholderia gladioli]
MNEHEKIPAQGGEMPPVERAADTGGRGINTVRGATSAGNAAQDRNTNAAALTDDFRGNDTNLVRSIEALIALNDEGALVPHGIGGLARVLLSAAAVRLTSPRAAVPRHVLASLECTAVWLEKGNDPQDAARELRACLAKIDAAPAAPVAEPAPDPLRRRVERLLVELHAEGRLSEGQCAKMLDISRVDWRELAEFLAPAAQAVAADGARAKDVVTREQVEAWARQAGISHFTEQRLERLGDFAIFARAAVSPATADMRAALSTAKLRIEQRSDDEQDGEYWSAAQSILAVMKLLDDMPEFFADVAAAPAEAREHDDPEIIAASNRGYAAGLRDGKALGACGPLTADARKPLQSRVQPWMLECFGPTIAADRVERNHRFLEEALELVQSLGCTASEAHQLVDYTFGRPVGEPAQEVGGVMVTLAALCLANTLDMHAAGEAELARISAPAMVKKIRAKQAAKPKHSPLPETPANPGEAVATNLDRHMITVWRDGKWKLWTYSEACLAGRDRDWLINISIPPMVQGAKGGKGGKA